jgi:hypothetical protein
MRHKHLASRSHRRLHHPGVYVYVYTEAYAYIQRPRPIYETDIRDRYMRHTHLAPRSIRRLHLLHLPDMYLHTHATSYAHCAGGHGRHAERGQVAHVCSRMLTYDAQAGTDDKEGEEKSLESGRPVERRAIGKVLSRRMLTYVDVCWRMLTYADVCWRMLTYAGVCSLESARCTATTAEKVVQPA